MVDIISRDLVCSNCGCDVTTSDICCPSCGCKHFKETIYMICPHCGEDVLLENTEDNFLNGYRCPECGEELGIDSSDWILEG